MNSERGIDLNTDLQRAYVVVTITDEKTSLLQNKTTNEFIFVEEPSFYEEFINYHLHILYPDRDFHTGKRGFAIKNCWAIESLQSREWRDGEYVGPHVKPVIYNPEVHSEYCNRILASTENLMGINSDYIDFEIYPAWDNTKIKDVYNICNTLVEAYAKMKGEMKYVMVQPFYSLHSDIVVDNKPYTSVEYKKDENEFIAVFPAIAYNKACLINQLY